MADRTEQLLEELLAKVARLEAASGKPGSTGCTLEMLYKTDSATWAVDLSDPRCDDRDRRRTMHMRGIFKPALAHMGERIADSITKQDWIYFRDQVRAKQITKLKGTPTVYTLNYEIRQWRALLRRQAELGNCTTNPLVGLRPIRGEKKHRETEPTVADLEKLRPHCDAQLWAFVLLAFRRGFRASEARRLEWRQIDLEQGLIHLRPSQEKIRRGGVMRVTSDVIEALRAIKPDVGRYVFPGKFGPLAATTMWRKVRAAIDAAELEAAPGDRRMTYHDWRHAAVSNWARKLSLQVAMRLSRHKSLSAAQRYIHVNDRDLEAAYEVMEQEATNRKPPKRVVDDEVNPEGSSSTRKS